MARRKRGPSKAAQRKGGRAAAKSRKSPIGRRKRSSSSSSSRSKKRSGGKNFIQGAIKNKGALRRTLGTGKSGKIPVKKIQKAAKGSGKTAQRARLALTLRKLGRKRRKR